MNKALILSTTYICGVDSMHQPTFKFYYGKQAIVNISLP